jgi:hypothetical protein
MDLYPLHQADVLTAPIDRSKIVADVPLYLFDAMTVEASLKRAPPALCILDTAAATHPWSIARSSRPISKRAWLRRGSGGQASRARSGCSG